MLPRATRSIVKHIFVTRLHDGEAFPNKGGIDLSIRAIPLLPYRIRACVLTHVFCRYGGERNEKLIFDRNNKKKLRKMRKNMV